MCVSRRPFIAHLIIVCVGNCCHVGAQTLLRRHGLSDDPKDNQLVDCFD